MTQITRILIVVLLVVQPALSQVSLTRLAQMDSVIAEQIANKKLPGAAVIVGRKGRVVWQKAYGDRALEPVREAMTDDRSSTSRVSRR